MALCSGVMGPCHLDGNCLLLVVAYRATVEDTNTNINSNACMGLTSSTFKKRFYAHKSTFENKNHEHHTTQSLTKNFKLFFNWLVQRLIKDLNFSSHTHTGLARPWLSLSPSISLWDRKINVNK